MKGLSNLEKIVSIAIIFSILIYPALMVAASDQRAGPEVGVSNAQAREVISGAGDNLNADYSMNPSSQCSIERIVVL